MFWNIQNGHRLHGVVMGHFQGAYHLFTTKQPYEEEKGIRHRTVHHAVSKDLIHWEDWPDCIGVGQEGQFDGFTIYDLHVVEHGGRYWMFYTGLDKPNGYGQKQAVGLATSDDLVKWEKHPANPVLRCDLRWYEDFLPDEAIYQEKDRGRQWFRDPWVYRNPETGEFGMAVGARAAGFHPDVNGCVAWATSRDMLHWQAAPPLFLPHRFHTVECPVLFEQGGRHYLIYLTHPAWGTPLMTTDPHQRRGGFYAVSSEGWAGPYVQPEDEVLAGGVFAMRGMGGFMRNMVFRTVDAPDGTRYAHYHHYVLPADGDSAKGHPRAAFADRIQVMPLPKVVECLPNGDLALTCNPVLDGLSRPMETPSAKEVSPGWKCDAGRWTGKNFGGQTVQLFGGELEDGIYSLKVRFVRGLRAGVVLRADGPDGPGWRILLDRNHSRIEFSALGSGEVFDLRAWKPSGGWTEVKAVCLGPDVEIYVGGKLMLHQTRYKERGVRFGMAVEEGEAQFEGAAVRVLEGVAY